MCLLLDGRAFTIILAHLLFATYLHLFYDSLPNYKLGISPDPGMILVHSESSLTFMGLEKLHKLFAA